MRQCRLIRPGLIELAEAEVPAPAPGEVLVAVRAALTCGTDLKAFRRGHPMIPMPGPFGHEFSGEVAAVGRGVENFKPGDAIMAVHSAPCLQCAYCRKNLFNLCERIMDTKVLGAFAEYVLVPAHVARQNVFPKPPSLTFAEAALLEPLACVVHGISPLGIRQGDTAYVIGAGPIGLLHVVLLKRLGARVAISDGKTERLDAAQALGADFTLFKGERVPPPIDEIASGIGFDYVFECTGRPEVWQRSIDHLRRGGTVVLFGGCPSDTTVTWDTHRIHYDELTLKGDFHFTPDDVREAYRLLTEGGLRLSGLITSEHPLSEIRAVFDLLGEGKGLKYALIP